MLGFFFWLNCVGVLGLHGGDGGDERERERERGRKRERGGGQERQKLERDINIFYHINILF